MYIYLKVITYINILNFIHTLIMKSENCNESEEMNINEVNRECGRSNNWLI